MYSGVQGKQWDIGDGKPQLKDETLALRTAGGDEWIDTQIHFLDQLIGLSAFTIHPKDGLPLNLFESPDVYKKSLTPLQKDFSEFYGVEYPAQIFLKKLEEGKNQNQANLNTIAVGLLPTPPDDIKRKEARFTDLAGQYAAKAVLAKSDEQFQAVKAEALEEFKKAGAAEVGDWYLKAWEEAKRQSEQY